MQVPEGKWLVAVSGGPDSMALLNMCIENGTEIGAVHVNYHHRDQAEEEECYVRNFCREHGTECYVKNDPFIYTGNFEAAARTWRYDFFVETASRYGYKGILVAHHEDDLLETYLMQEEKNIIPAYYGLKEGSVYKGVRILRPLLSWTKKELEEYCRSRGIRYYVDATNADESYMRNRIRHQLIEPMTRFERDMVLREIKQKNAVMQERRCRVKTLIRTDRVNRMQYCALGEDDRLTLLRMTAEAEKSGSSLSLKQLKEIDHVICSRKDFCISVKGRLLVQDDGFFFMKNIAQPYEDVYDDLKSLKKGGRKDCYTVLEGECGVYAVSLKAEDFPITIRTVRPGDRIALRFGTKAVHRFFVDRHIPLYRRQMWPVVCNHMGEVILVPGIGCDIRHFSATPDVNVVEYTLHKGD